MTLLTKIDNDSLLNVIDKLNSDDITNLFISDTKLAEKLQTNKLFQSKIKLKQFNEGRKYQYLLDKYPLPTSLSKSSERFYAIRKFLKTFSRAEIDILVDLMVKKGVPVYGRDDRIKRVRKFNYATLSDFNITDFDFNLGNDPYYQGRCFQFLLDTDHKLNYKEIEQPIEEAEDKNLEIRSRIPYGKEFSHGLCYRCDGYSYPDKRCECNNVRILVHVWDNSLHLDHKEVSFDLESH